jgi:signal recognition particle subunit SRP54
MFESLTSSLQGIFKDLRGHGRLTEGNVRDALREVRMSLLEADVNVRVAKTFIARVKEASLGEDVLRSVTPGQQVIKRMHEELVRLLGEHHCPLSLSNGPAAGAMLLGLHGAGKTTTAAKLAARWKKQGLSVLLAACDIRRPAAVDQLNALAKQIGVPIETPRPGEGVVEVGRRARERAEHEMIQRVLYDTGGRFQLDEELLAEVRALRETVLPEAVLLVLDAAIGQESVHVAEAFHREAGVTGLILTKLDGDARGGAALSVQSVTGCSVALVGTGERFADLEPFDPARMASRILGMGDVVGLVERAQETFEAGDAERMRQKMRRHEFTLDDFLSQIRQMRKLGPMQQILDMLPGAGTLPSDAAEQSEREIRRAESLIQSMTPWERRHPARIDASRRRRIAGGAGREVRDVNELLKRFKQSQQMMKNMKKLQKGLPNLPF